MDVRIVSLFAFILLFGAISLTVGHLLRTHGIVFLEHVFGSEGRVAGATNALLNIGYYLLTLSLLSLNASEVASATNGYAAIQVVAVRLGRSVLVIAVIHFFNMLIFTMLMRRAAIREAANEWKVGAGAGASTLSPSS